MGKLGEVSLLQETHTLAPKESDPERSNGMH